MRFPKALALAGVFISLVACSSGGSGTRTEDQPTVMSGVSDNFDQRNMVVTASCSPGNPNTLISVDGWNPQNWQHLVHAEFRLPETAVTTKKPSKRNTAVRDLCEQEDGKTPDADDLSRIRALFDQHFTKMAVVTHDAQTGASHVGYVDRSGRFVDVTGAEGFGTTPKEEGAALSWDGGTIWFTYEARAASPDNSAFTQTRVASRSVSGDRKLVDHMHNWTPATSLVTLGASGKVAMDQGAHMAPDGRHVVVDGRLLDTPADKDVIAYDSRVDGPTEPGRPLCNVAGWVNNDTVLCSSYEPNQVVTLGIAADAKPSAPLLPDNDRANHALAVSPNGKQFAFVSVRQKSMEYYLSATTPGSTPVKIEGNGPFATSVLVEWR
jgi:hypothetical protein